MTENGKPSEARGRTVLVGLDLLVSLWLWCRRWNVLTRVHGRLGWTACDGDTPFLRHGISFGGCLYVFVERDLPGSINSIGPSVVWVPWPGVRSIAAAVPRHSMGVLLFFFLLLQPNPECMYGSSCTEYLPTFRCDGAFGGWREVHGFRDSGLTGDLPRLGRFHVNSTEDAAQDLHPHPLQSCCCCCCCCLHRHSILALEATQLHPSLPRHDVFFLQPRPHFIHTPDSTCISLAISRRSFSWSMPPVPPTFLRFRCRALCEPSRFPRADLQHAGLDVAAACLKHTPASPHLTAPHFPAEQQTKKHRESEKQPPPLPRPRPR